MHLLFLHSNFPAQFGQIAAHLIRDFGDRCTFVSEKQTGEHLGIDCYQYVPTHGATEKSHVVSRTFENQMGRSFAAAQAVASIPNLAPVDLIVAHSGFVSPIFISEQMPDVPVLGYFEYFYHRTESDFDFRFDLPATDPIAAMRLRARNATLLLDLHHCAAGYCPTEFQRSQMPAEFQPKLDTIFDGIDVDFWKPLPASETSRTVAGITIPADHQVITFVSRGFESMRGADLFLKVVDRICRARKNVTVLVVGDNRVAYSGDLRFTGGKSFRQWVLDQNDFDLSSIHFVGRITPTELVHVFSLSDVHLYWTAPFVLSWSMMNAMSCGCAVIGSNTPPVAEMIRHGHNGWLVDFFDIEAWVNQTIQVLDAPRDRELVAHAARETIVGRYELSKCLAKMRSLYRKLTGNS